MSSIVGRLARTLSQGNDRNDYARSRLSTESKDFPRSTSMAARMPASPSFNDFSLMVEQDAVDEWGSLTNTKSSNSNLASMDVGETSAPVRVPQESFLSSWSSKSVFAAASDEVPASPSATPASPSKYKKMKIMGMDPYDYCDLLRSGSL